MKCPHCDAEKTSLLRQRVTEDYVARDRRCPKCRAEFRTIEIGSPSGGPGESVKIAFVRKLSNNALMVELERRLSDL